MIIVDISSLPISQRREQGAVSTDGLCLIYLLRGGGGGGGVLAFIYDLTRDSQFC